MTGMFRIIEEAHRFFGAPTSSYPRSCQGDLIDPAVLPLNNFNRVDLYVLAVLQARNAPEISRDDFTCLVLPHLGTPRGFIQCGHAEVIWFLPGSNFYERDRLEMAMLIIYWDERRSNELASELASCIS